MRGTRYGDFSRFIEPSQGAGALLMQQGRVQLDADWNAQAELSADRLAGAVADLLGASGACPRDPGYALRVRPTLGFDGGGGLRSRSALPLGLAGDGTFTIELALRWEGGPATVIDFSAHRHDPAGDLQIAVRDDGVITLVQRAAAENAHATVAAREPLAQGRESHVAVVCRHGEVRLWLDGRPVAEGRLRATPPAAQRTVVLGAAGARHGRLQPPYLVGTLGDVRVWGSARAGEELGRELNAGAERLPEDLLAWWPLDDGRHEAPLERVRGEAAVPEGDAPPTWRLGELTVGPGRFYVGGVPVTLGRRTAFDAQPWAPGATIPKSGRHLLYLEVWEETLAAADDPALVEPALAGLDTTVRTAIRWAVRHVPAPSDRDLDAEQALAEALRAAPARATGRMAAEHAGVPVAGNWLYRVEVHDSGHTEGEVIEFAVLDVDADTGVIRVAEAWRSRGGDETVDVVGVSADGEPVTVSAAVTPVAEDQARRTLRVAGGAAALAGLREPALRRRAPRPTFKWSRRNAAQTLTVAPVAGDATRWELVGGEVDLSGLALGTPVEAIVATAVGTGIPAALRRVVDVDPDAQQLVFDAPPAPGHSGPLRLRVWDRQPEDADEGEGEGESVACLAEIVADEWLELENGIRIRFEPGGYRSGDYWWIVAREDGPPVRWPRRHGHPVLRAPDGIERRHAPLALLDLEDGFELHDLRGTARGLVSVARLGGAERDDDQGAEPESAEGAEPERAEGAEPERAEAQPAQDADSGERAGTPGESADSGSAPEADDDEDGFVLPPGFAVLGPLGAEASGLRATGVELTGRRVWGAPVILALPGSEKPVALMSVTRGLIVVTGESIWLAESNRSITRLTTLPEPRERFACACAGDIVLLIGGRGRGGGRPDGRLLTFDLADDAWVTGRRPLPTPVDDPAAVIAAAGDAASLHVLGGGHERGDRPTNAHQIYDLASDRWRPATAFHEERKGAAAGVAGNELHLFGGATRRGRHLEPIASHEILNLDTGGWSPGTPLPFAGASTDAATGAAGIVAAASRGAYMALGLCAYDADSGAWLPLPSPPRRLDGEAVAVHDGQVYVVGRDAGGETVLLSLAPEQRWGVYVPAEGESPGNPSRG